MKLRAGPSINREVLEALAIDRPGAWTAAEVADWLGLDRIQATNALARLLRNGMVLRCVDRKGRTTFTALVKP